nr:hypothetical protein BaRGS_016917 [Batillaria attramentaria]
MATHGKAQSPPVPALMKTNCACTEEKKTIQLAYDIWDVEDATKISWFWDPRESTTSLPRTAKFRAIQKDGGILYFDSKEIPSGTVEKLGEAKPKMFPPKTKEDTSGSYVVTISRPNEQLSIQEFFGVV